MANDSRRVTASYVCVLVFWRHSDGGGTQSQDAWCVNAAQSVVRAAAAPMQTFGSRLRCKSNTLSGTFVCARCVALHCACAFLVTGLSSSHRAPRNAHSADGTGKLIVSLRFTIIRCLTGVSTNWCSIINTHAREVIIGVGFVCICWIWGGCTLELMAWGYWMNAVFILYQL